MKKNDIIPICWQPLEGIWKTWGILKVIVNKNMSNQLQSKFKLSDNAKYMIYEKFNELLCQFGLILQKNPVSLEEVANIFQNS